MLDENLSPNLKIALLRHSPAIDVLRIGDRGAPPLGIADPTILRFLEDNRRLLITENRATMGVHGAQYLETGRHHWGIVRIRPGAAVGQVIASVLLIWDVSEAEEWIDVFDWIPFRSVDSHRYGDPG